MKTLSFLLFLLFSYSCAHSRAEELYNNKLYKESLKEYEAILKRNPEDVEAKIGRQKSKSGIISEMVIEIRLQRLAGNQKTAADKLVDLIEFESKWNDKLNYSAGQSQQKELDYARKYLVSSGKQCSRSK